MSGRQLDPGQSAASVVYTRFSGEWSGIGLAEAQPDGSFAQSGTIAFETPIGIQDMRDPWILRTDDGWLMLIGAGAKGQDEAFVFAYRSADGKQFVPAGRFDTGGVDVPGEYWELPMLFPRGDRWVLTCNARHCRLSSGDSLLDWRVRWHPLPP